VADPVSAQNGDPANGSKLARAICADCHATSLEQLRSPKSGAPTFHELATTPGMTRSALMVAFTTPHVGMPMFILTPEQREDIAGYILSLQNATPTPGK
jgi:mono/diheme cytochrome c family protein